MCFITLKQVKNDHSKMFCFCWAENINFVFSKNLPSICINQYSMGVGSCTFSSYLTWTSVWGPPEARGSGGRAPNAQAIFTNLSKKNAFLGMLWCKFLLKITILIYGTAKCVDTPPPSAPRGVYPLLLCHLPQIYSFNTLYWSKL